MKRSMIIIALLIVCMPIASMAQSDHLVKKGEKGLYLEHKVAAKEGLYSIGRLYSVHPKYLAAYNKFDIAKGLSIGQVVQIPLSDTNFTQKTSTPTALYYIVGEKEGLMKVSNTFNKVTLQKLRDWNNLSSDNLAVGKKIVVGYLLGAGAPPPPAAEPVVKNDPPAPKTEVVTPAPAEQSKPFKVEEKPFNEPAKETAKKDAVKEDSDVPPPPIVEEKREVPKTSPKTEAPKPAPEVKVTSDGGYFKTAFNQQVKTTPASHNEAATSGIFKTESGWKDEKYYMLMDKVPTGTIIKVINPENGKAIYAKVLGEMSGIKQNQGLDIRVSNAAASALGVTDADKFILTVNY